MLALARKKIYNRIGVESDQKYHHRILLTIQHCKVLRPLNIAVIRVSRVMVK